MVATGEVGSTFQQRVYRAVAPHAWPRGISPFNKLVLASIVLASVMAVIETEEGVVAAAPRLFLALDQGFGILFSAEFALRLWAAGADPRWSGVRGRIRWLLRPIALIDLLAIVPSFLALVGPDAFLLRLVRLARILRLAQLGQFSDAMQLITEAVRSRRYELGVSLLAAGAVLLASAVMLYLVEGQVQPDAYGSIPRALWWSIVTLTTVGYGDVYPVTLAGRMLGGLTALAGIGLIAMPTGILAAAFSDAFQKRRAP